MKGNFIKFFQLERSVGKAERDTFEEAQISALQEEIKATIEKDFNKKTKGSSFSHDFLWYGTKIIDYSDETN